MVHLETLYADWVICRVPPDIWRHIFGLSDEEFCVGRNVRSYKGIIQLSHVCSSWRGIINGAAELWTRVDVRIDLRKPALVPEKDFLSHILRNARNMPLTMSLQAHGNPDINTNLGPVIEVGGLFFGAAKRAKHLELVASKQFPFQELEADIQASPTLQSLSIDLPYYDDCITSIVSKLWNPAPSLRSLVLKSSSGSGLDCAEYVEALKFPFQQLASLNVTSPAITVDTFTYLMTSTPFLLTASLPTPTHGPGTRRFALQDVELPSLKELSLRSAKSSIASIQLLKFVKSPSLTTLRLIDEHGWSPSAFKVFLKKSSPSIEHIRLGIVQGEDEKIACLAMLPLVRILDLRIEPHTGRIEPEIGEDFCAAMQDWDESTQTFVLCPKLETLVVDHRTLDDTNQTFLADMVEERRQRALAAGKTFRLEMATRRDRRLDGSQEIRRICELVPLGLDAVISMNGSRFD